MGVVGTQDHYTVFSECKYIVVEVLGIIGGGVDRKERF